MVDNTGVNGASFAGGTEIVIFGAGMSHTPTMLSAIFNNKEMGGANQGRNANPCKYLSN